MAWSEGLDYMDHRYVDGFPRLTVVLGGNFRDDVPFIRSFGSDHQMSMTSNLEANVEVFVMRLFLQSRLSTSFEDKFLR